MLWLGFYSGVYRAFNDCFDDMDEVALPPTNGVQKIEKLNQKQNKKF